MSVRILANLAIKAQRQNSFQILSGIRSYAVYPSYFVKPVSRPVDIKNLEESGEADKLAFLPILPPFNNDTNASAWNDPLVNKFINQILRKGNKVLARGLVEQAFEKIKRIQLEKYKKAKTPEEKEQIVLNPWEIFHKAIENIRPMLHVIPIKKGGHTYQVPVPLEEKRSYFMAMKWIHDASKDYDKFSESYKNDQVKFHKNLAYELLNAYNNEGRCIKKKYELHKICEANRAYAHYKWS